MDSWNVIAPLYDKLDEYVSYARRFVLDPTEAEDICHEAFMDLKRQTERGGHIKKPAAYLRRSIRNAANDRNTAYDTRRDAGPHLAALTEARQQNTASEAIFNVAFNTALTRLPDDQRRVFVLCQLRGVSQQEAAAKLRLNQSTVSRLYESARRSIAKELA